MSDPVLDEVFDLELDCMSDPVLDVGLDPEFEALEPVLDAWVDPGSAGILPASKSLFDSSSKLAFLSRNSPRAIR
jgi:hypothetical protein